MLTRRNSQLGSVTTRVIIHGQNVKKDMARHICVNSCSSFQVPTSIARSCALINPTRPISTLWKSHPHHSLPRKPDSPRPYSALARLLQRMSSSWPGCSSPEGNKEGRRALLDGRTTRGAKSKKCQPSNPQDKTPPGAYLAFTIGHISPVSEDGSVE